MQSSERRFEQTDVRFFLELTATVAMIMFLWSLLGGCSFAKSENHPTVSLSDVQIGEPSPKQRNVVPKKAVQRSEAKTKHYTVRRRDTLYGIAKKTGTSVHAIVMANGITDPSRLVIGQVLVLPAGK